MVPEHAHTHGVIKVGGLGEREPEEEGNILEITSAGAEGGREGGI